MAVHRVRSRRHARGTALAVLLLVLHGPALALGSGPERLRDFLDGLTTVRAEFTQVLFDENMQRVEESGGTLYVHRPGRFRWDYREPYAQEIVGDGEQVWMHDVELDQVTVKDAATALAGTPAALLSSDRPVDESFDVRDLGVQGEVAWVGLKPRGDEPAGFEDIRLAFDGTALSLMELVDGFGQLTQLRFTRVSRNTALDDDLFRFRPPAGADVVGPDR